MHNRNEIDRGKLQVTVLTDDGKTPLEGATVKITDTSANTVLDELTTDSSGQTDAAELPAPPIEYSIAEIDKKPYTTYNALIKAEGFETLHIGGIQVLPTSTSIQVCVLNKAVPNGFNVRNLFIGEHVLWGKYPAKIPEAAVKELPKATGFVVLPEPVVPEFIVVHLGQPEDPSAKDEWVYYKDYIKNVASSEIYSTWQPETIRANVLAIISFTLNRVYTEWYRGKGKQFTVTNSTAFDQAYRSGATIFEEISAIVDEIFNTYITTETIRQPLFTQYCDGRRTQCKGLSQWGSQALGEQGMDAVSILKRYYGSDIYLATADKVEGVPHSYGGVVLAEGSTGQDVSIIQQQLNAISQHYPAIPKQKVDSVYSENTAEAVRIFQKIFHLSQTGAVDFATWYEISNIYVGITKMA